MSIRAHGGAVRYWRHKDNPKRRACLCQDGVILILKHGKWDSPENGHAAEEWEEDTRSSVSAAITRTNREARRGS